MADAVATEQLLELLVTLKKTTPTAARTILNSQPPIAYALMKLMVEMNAIDTEVVQKTLAEYGSTPVAMAPPPAAVLPPTGPPMAAIPPHMQAPPASAYRTATPPQHTPTPPYASAPVYPGHGAPTYPPYSTPTPTPGPPPAAPHPAPGVYPPPQATMYGLPPAPAPVPGPASTPAVPALAPSSLAGISEEHKALIIRVVSMTPEQLAMLPPHERNLYIQIRASLGVPTG